MVCQQIPTEVQIIPNLIKIQLFIILLYEDLTAVHSRSCADDFCNFHRSVQAGRIIGVLLYNEELYFNQIEIILCASIITAPLC